MWAGLFSHTEYGSNERTSRVANDDEGQGGESGTDRSEGTKGKRLTSGQLIDVLFQRQSLDKEGEPQVDVVYGLLALADCPMTVNR